MDRTVTDVDEINLYLDQLAKDRDRHAEQEELRELDDQWTVEDFMPEHDEWEIFRDYWDFSRQ